METIIVDAGPFIHLNQINQINLLKNFSSLYTTATVISEIRPDNQIPLERICCWENLKIITVKDSALKEIEELIARFRLHKGESEILYLAGQHRGPIVLTDDLNARTAAQTLGFEVHGTVGILTYAFYNKWLSRHQTETSLRLLYERSSLFITSAIIEKALREIK